MTYKTWIAWAISLLTATSVLAAAPTTRPADFGKQWVRSHPFVLMGLCLNPVPLDVGQYCQAGLTYMLAWKPHHPDLMKSVDQEGIAWFGHMNTVALTPAEYQARFDQYTKDYPGNVGWLVSDEPAKENLESVGQAMEWARQTYPDKLIFSNLAGYRDYPQYTRSFLRVLRPDVLMFDTYPMGPTHEGIPEADMWFSRMIRVREEALKADIPYWAFVQSLDRPSTVWYSESDLRMQLFTYLTCGYTGLAYFMYDYSRSEQAYGFINEDGTPSPIYHHAVGANKEIRTLGEALKHLTSTHFFSVPVSPNIEALVNPEIVPMWSLDEEVPADPVRSIDIVEPGAGRHGLIGYFRDDHGQRYFMLTNAYRRHGQEEGPAEKTKLTFRVHFDPSIKSLVRLDRDTGQPILMPIENQQEGLLLTLPGGTGDLFLVGNGSFPK